MAEMCQSQHESKGIPVRKRHWQYLENGNGHHLNSEKMFDFSLLCS